MNKLIKFVKIIIPFIVILTVGLWLIKPFFIHGFFPMHDDTQVTRVFEMAYSLRDGLFPVRWVNDLGYGYGYPIFNFYAPLSYYVGSIFAIFGFSALISTKIMIGIGFILSGISMYLLAKVFWGKLGGAFAAFCYLLAPYHALDTYVRGDIAELYAYAFLPLAVYGIWQSYKTNKWRFVIVGSIGFAGIILSHNLTAFMVTPFLFIASVVLIFLKKKEKIIIRLFPLLILFLGAVLAGFYWIPVFPEMSFTNVLSQVGGGADFHQHFVCPLELWNSPWGYGGSAPGCVDGISFSLSKFYIFISIIALISVPFIYKKNRENTVIIAITVFFLIISLVLLLPYSEFIWNLIHPLAFLQYPWRFLLLCAFYMSFLGGAIVFILQEFIKGRVRIIIYIFLFILSAAMLYQQGKYFVPRYIYPTDGSNFTEKSKINWDISKISDEYMPKNFQKPKLPEEVPQGFIAPFLGQVVSLDLKTQKKVFILASDKEQNINIRLAYFPAWHAYLDDKPVQIVENATGMELNIPKGKHTLTLIFENTPIELIGDITSLTGIFMLILGIIIL